MFQQQGPLFRIIRNVILGYEHIISLLLASPQEHVRNGELVNADFGEQELCPLKMYV